MESENVNIGEIPAIIWGKPSNNIYLYIHGKNGNKGEMEQFVDIFIEKGLQVLSFDLPEHGDRKKEKTTLEPWNVVPELKKIMNHLKENWSEIGIIGNSIGCWFSLLAFQDEKIENSLFIAPILNMEQLIINMMDWASVTESELKNKKKIETAFGETLSWEYYNYTRDNPIDIWNIKTKILYPEKDNMTDIEVVKKFVEKPDSELTMLYGAEHYIHKPNEIEFLRDWLDTNL
ncbi:MAG: alpha/beta hydrolase [Tissierellia bacterium]|nr:alpha/beta hydrolase [Tissierellia bacterium]